MIKAKYLAATAVMSWATVMPTAAFAQSAPQGQPSTTTGGSSAAAGSAVAPSGNTSAPGARGSGGIQDIVVTARRTEESLQKTPVAVTAIGTVALERAQVQTQVDLQRTAPGLVVSTGAPSSSGFTYVSIRGQGNLNPGVANDPAVGTYVDGVYIARPSQGVTDLDDIQRVEVLRGPQGTLFGRNTTGGALNILTNDPTGEFSATAKGEIGNYGYREGGLIVNAPIDGDELGARITYNYRTHDGYAHNDSLDRDQADLLSHFVRGKVRWAPAGSAFSLTLSGDYNHQKDSGAANSLGAVDPNATFLSGTAGIGGLFPPTYAQLLQYLHTKDNWYQGYATGFTPTDKPDGGTLPFDRLTAWGTSATMNLNLDTVKIKSITAYRYSNSVGLIDLDATPIDLLATISGYKSHAFSQELQISGNIGSRFNYITGAYYSHETGREFSRASTLGFVNSALENALGLPAGALGSPVEFLNDGGVKNISTGVFAQGYYKITDKLRFSGGLRWTWDTRDVVLRNLQNAALPNDATIVATDGSTSSNCLDPSPRGTGCGLPRSAKFNYPAYTAGLDYQAADTLFLYAKTSRASKAGGFNLRQGSEATPAFAPETAKDVEAGFKYTTPSRVFRLNAAVFQTWTSDVQRNASALVNGISTQFLRNAGKTRIHGAEFEATLAPVRGLEIDGNLALLRGHYKKGSFLDIDPVFGIPVDRSGEPLPQLPKTQFGVGATYTTDASFGKLVLHTDYAYVSSQYFNPITAPAGIPANIAAQYAIQNQQTHIPGYGLLNGRVAVDIGHTGIEAYVFAQNILQKKYLVRSFADLYIPLGFSTEYVGNPRTFGIGMKVSLGGKR